MRHCVAKHLFLRMKLFISIILFLVCVNCAAQSFENIETFTTQNGLSNNFVSCLEKDAEGFLWVGTHEGLNQYDGTEFINVLSNSKNNLPSNVINKICSIDKTTLIVSTQGGMSFLDTKTLEGRIIEKPGAAAGAKEPLLAWDFLYDKKEKEIWVGAVESIYVLTTEGKLKRQIKATKTNGVFAGFLFMDRSGNVFFYSQQLNGFFYPDFDKDELIPVEKKMPEFPLNNFLGQYAFRNATFENNKIICCFTNKNAGNIKNLLAYYDNTSGRLVIDSFLVKNINYYFANNAFQVNDATLLMNSYFGEPSLYDLNTRQLRPVADHPIWFTSWPDGLGARLLVEKENIWVATTKGLLQIPQYASIFKMNDTVIGRIRENKSLVSFNNGTWHNGKFWMACMGAGAFAVDTVTNKVQALIDKNTPAKFLAKAIATEVMEVGNAFWLFSAYGAAQINDAAMKMLDVDAQNKDVAVDKNSLSPFKDSKGNIWISLPDGIAKYSPATNSFTGYKNKAAGGAFPLGRSVFKTEDGNGNIWFARQDTLVKFDQTEQRYTLHYLKKDGVPIKPVLDLAGDGKDLLYMHVKGALGIYHISTGEINLYTKQTGIVSTVINEIATDKRGNPWIATEGGLVYYDSELKRFYSYTKADGLPDNNVLSLNFTNSSKTELFLGFSASYCVFDPEKLLQKRNAGVRNTITGVEVNGKAIAFDDGRIFSYEDNSISFSYTGINFTAGPQNSYAYMLEGFDKTWKYSGKKRQCSYVNLPPGDYTFKIKSANQQGEWNETPATFSFTIKAPFWQTWWFRSLVAILAIMLIYWFIKRRDGIKAKENKVALQMSELKLTALQSQMNPHFIFNSLNSIQNYILKQDREAAARYLTKFSRLMRRILDHSFNNLTPLHEIIETLKMYMELEAFRFNNEFSWEVRVDNDDSINDVKLPPLLLQPYVENAIIHGLMQKEGDKKILINIYKENNELHCIIDDNGIGRGNKLTDTKGHISRGQKLTADMLATMKQLLHTNAQIKITDKKDEENNPAGTTVDLIIPLT